MNVSQMVSDLVDAGVDFFVIGEALIDNTVSSLWEQNVMVAA